jgi:hypothetical protein
LECQIDARGIIIQFGGQSSLAESIHTRQSTVQHWAKTNHIPSKWHTPILEAAVFRGLPIRPEHLPGANLEQTDVSKTKIPEAKWAGVLDIWDEEMPCYVLDDERRVITRKAAVDFLTAGKGGGNLESYIGMGVLKPFMPKDIEDQFFEISLSNVDNKTAKAMSASSFIDICRAYSRARDTGALETETQAAIAIRASTLLAAFAKNGIEGAIDEVTGYQYERAADAMQTRLHLFLEAEMREWEKTFPDELWIQFGRLTKWSGAVNQRPKYWGKLVMELVYGYLNPDVAKWLKEHAPEPRKGRNYHQWLTAQYGLKKLLEHIWMLIGLASACRDMPELRQRMAEKYGRRGVQLTMYLPPGVSKGQGKIR